jgi:queuine/archaeosine tRNA-ribosyltransferase
LESHPLTKEAKCTDEEIKEILHNLNSEVAAVVDEPTTASKWKNHCAAMLYFSCFFWSVASSIPTGGLRPFS